MKFTKQQLKYIATNYRKGSRLNMVSTRLDNATLEQLKQQADKLQISKAQLMATLIEEGLK